MQGHTMCPRRQKHTHQPRARRMKTRHTGNPDGWTNVIAIDYMQSGHYIMYDMIATTPYFASGYLDPIYKV